MTACRELLTLHERSVYLVQADRGQPAVYYLVDQDAGGVLINSPAYTEPLHTELAALAPLRYLFYPSRLGARDVDRWRATDAQSIAFGPEAQAIAGEVDIEIDGKSKLTRTIGFLPMSGRTQGSCALHCRNIPGVIFFGPILTPGDSGWPALNQNEDDFSYESRLFGCLGLQDIKYEYAFTDTYVGGTTRIGPGADKGIRAEIARVLE